MREYRKTYKPFIAWILALLPVMLGSATLAEKAGLDDRGIVAAMMTVVVLMLLLLLWMVWKGEYVYWITSGPSFEAAKAAGRGVRREYARKHFAAMMKGSSAALVLLAVEYFLGAHELVMMLSVAVCIVVSAISTIRIKWPEEKHDSQN